MNIYKIRFILGSLISVLMLIVFTSCGGGEQDSRGDVISSSESTSPMSSSVPKEKSEIKTIADASVGSSIDSGGVFNRLWSDPPTLDPHLTSDTTSAAIVVEIFGGLVSFDTDLNLVPDLAESWDVSSDSLTYTFNIRPDAIFHDGKKVRAQDFKWSFERAANPDTVSPVVETYLGDILGVQDVLDGNTSEISGIKAMDDETLQIRIDSPKAYFLQKLTYPTAFVVDKDNVNDADKTLSTTMTMQQF